MAQTRDYLPGWFNEFCLDFAAEVDRALRAPFEPAVEKAKSTTFNPIESVKETADLLFNVLTGRNFKGTICP